MTVNMLIIAPRAMSPHTVLMIAISEYTATPTVAVKKPSALTIIDGMEVRAASSGR